MLKNCEGTCYVGGPKKIKFCRGPGPDNMYYQYSGSEIEIKISILPTVNSFFRFQFKNNLSIFILLRNIDLIVF